MVTLPVPVLVKVTIKVELSPSTTFPKLLLVGLPDIRSVTPVPESETLAGEFSAVLLTEAVPVMLPAAVGVKLTLKTALWSANSVMGSEGPLTANPAPVTVVCKSVTGPMPVLATLKVWLLELPTVTPPKLKLVGDALQDKTCAETLGAFSRQYIVSIIEVEN